MSLSRRIKLFICIWSAGLKRWITQYLQLIKLEFIEENNQVIYLEYIFTIRVIALYLMLSKTMHSVLNSNHTKKSINKILNPNHFPY